ncbi:hypothetical protein ACOMHN_021657 [Nucella lapillus]
MDTNQVNIKAEPAEESWESPSCPFTDDASAVALSLSSESVTSCSDKTMSSGETTSRREHVPLLPHPLLLPDSEKICESQAGLQTPPSVASAVEKTMTSFAQATPVTSASTSAAAAQQLPGKPLNLKLQISQDGGLRLAPGSAGPVVMAKLDKGGGGSGSPRFFVHSAGKQPQLLMGFPNQPSMMYLLKASSGQQLNLKVASPPKQQQPARTATSASGLNVSQSGKSLPGVSGASPPGTSGTFQATKQHPLVIMSKKNVSILKPKEFGSPFSKRVLGPRKQTEVKKRPAKSLLSHWLPVPESQFHPDRSPGDTGRKRKNTARKSVSPSKKLKTTSLLRSAFTEDNPQKVSEPSPSTSFQEDGFEDVHNFPFKIGSVFSLASDDQQFNDLTWEDVKPETKEEKPVKVEDLCHTTVNLREMTPEKLSDKFGSSFVVVERLDRTAMDRKGRDQTHSQCSNHCRKRTLDYLCMLGLIRCPETGKRKFDEVEDAKTDMVTKKLKIEPQSDIVAEQLTDHAGLTEAEPVPQIKTYAADSGEGHTSWGDSKCTEENPDVAPPLYKETRVGVTDCRAEDSTGSPAGFGVIPTVCSQAEMSSSTTINSGSPSVRRSLGELFPPSTPPPTSFCSSGASESMPVLSVTSNQAPVASSTGLSCSNTNTDFSSKTRMESEAEHPTFAYGIENAAQGTASSENESCLEKGEGDKEGETGRNRAEAETGTPLTALQSGEQRLASKSVPPQRHCSGGSLSSVDPAVDTLASAPETVIDSVVSAPETVIGSVVSTPEAVTDGVVSAPETAIGSVVSTPEAVTDGVVSAPETAIGSVVSTPKTAIGSVVSAPETAIGSVVSTPKTATDTVVFALETIDTVYSAPETTMDTLESPPETVVDNVVSAPETAIDDVVSTPETAIDDVVSTPETVIDDVVSTPETAIDDVVSTTDTATDNVVSTTDTATDDVVSSLETVTDDVVSAPETAIDDVDSASQTATNTAVSASKSATDGVVSALETAINTAVSAPETAINTAVSAPETAINTAVSAPETAINTAVSAPETAINTAVSAPETAINTAVSAPETVINTAVSASETAINTAISAPETAINTAVSASETAINTAVLAPETAINTSVSAPETAINTAVSAPGTVINTAVSAPETAIDSRTTTTLAHTQSHQELKLSHESTPAVVPLVMTSSPYRVVPQTAAAPRTTSAASGQVGPRPLQYVIKFVTSASGTSSAPPVTSTAKPKMSMLLTPSGGQMHRSSSVGSTASTAPTVIQVMHSGAPVIMPAGVGAGKTPGPRKTLPVLPFVNVQNPAVRLLPAPAGISLLTRVPGNLSQQPLQAAGPFQLVQTVLPGARSVTANAVPSLRPVLPSVQSAAGSCSSQTVTQSAAKTAVPPSTPAAIAPIRALPGTAGKSILPARLESQQHGLVAASESAKRTASVGGPRPNANQPLSKRIIVKTPGNLDNTVAKQLSFLAKRRGLGSNNNAVTLIKVSNASKLGPVQIVPAVTKAQSPTVLTLKTKGVTGATSLPKVVHTSPAASVQKTSCPSSKLIKVSSAPARQQPPTAVQVSECIKVIAYPPNNLANQRATGTSHVNPSSSSSASLLRIPIIPQNLSGLQTPRIPVIFSKTYKDPGGVSLLGSSRPSVGSAQRAAKPSATARAVPSLCSGKPSAEKPTLTVITPAQVSQGQVGMSARKQPQFKIFFSGASPTTPAEVSVQRVPSSNTVPTMSPPSSEEGSTKGRSDKQRSTGLAMVSLLDSFTMPSPALVVTSSVSSTVMSTVESGSKSVLAVREEGLASKPTRVEEKYPLPPGVVIKTEPWTFGCPTETEPLPDSLDPSQYDNTSAYSSDTLDIPALDRIPVADICLDSATEFTDVPVNFERAAPPTSFLLTEPDFGYDSSDPPTDLDCPDLEPLERGPHTAVFDEPPVLTPVVSLAETLDSYVSLKKGTCTYSPVNSPKLKRRKKQLKRATSKTHRSSSRRSSSDPQDTGSENNSSQSSSFQENEELAPDPTDWQESAGPPSLVTPLTSLYSSRTRSEPSSRSSVETSSVSSSDRIRELKEMLKKQNEQLEHIRQKRTVQGPVAVTDD